MIQEDFACLQCGADLKYSPGAGALTCPYCGTKNEIEPAEDEIGERDFRAFLSKEGAGSETHEVVTVHCGSCGAESSLGEGVQSDACPFCGDTLVAPPQAHRLIMPQSLLPFKVPSEEARQQFRKWLDGLWFAPNKLKKMRKAAQAMQGIFLPHWTYDAACMTSYLGQRGVYYYVNKSYSTTNSKGETVRRTRRVRKTRWYPASGVVGNAFDDLLVVGSASLPVDCVRKLEPWDLPDLVKYDVKYLSGFRSERYTVGLEDGFEDARRQMRPEIERTIRRDIGGDTQRILHYDTGYRDVTFKHILLPVWLSAYRFKNKVYRFMVNARTGEVQGERPWSKVKIALATVALAAVIAAVVYFANAKG